MGLCDIDFYILFSIYSNIHIINTKIFILLIYVVTYIIFYYIHNTIFYLLLLD